GGLPPGYDSERPDGLRCHLIPGQQLDGRLDQVRSDRFGRQRPLDLFGNSTVERLLERGGRGIGRWLRGKLDRWNEGSKSGSLSNATEIEAADRLEEGRALVLQWVGDLPRPALQAPLECCHVAQMEASSHGQRSQRE